MYTEMYILPFTINKWNKTTEEEKLISLTQNEVNYFSRKLLEDYDSKRPGKIFQEKIKINNDDALCLQTAVANLREIRGEKVIGYKIGCVGRLSQQKMGLNSPVLGRLWTNELYQNGAILKKSNFTNPGMEAEFGIKLNRDIKPNLASFEYILASIKSIHPVIEIHNLIFYGNPPNGAELIANNAIHAGVVLGQPIERPAISINTDLKLFFDNNLIGSWSNKVWPSDILSKVKWLAIELKKLGNILKKGNLILTGAYGLPMTLDDKQLVQVKSSAFGNVSAIFN